MTALLVAALAGVWVAAVALIVCELRRATASFEPDEPLEEDEDWVWNGRRPLGRMDWRI